MKKITVNQPHSTTVNQCFDLFVKSCIARGLAKETVKGYGVVFKIFCQKMGCKDTDIADITPEFLEEFILRLQENGQRKEITISTYIRQIRVFLYFAMDRGYLRKFKITVPRAEKQVKETYSQQELKALLFKPNIRECSFTIYKTWVLENYLLGTGNRISSALNLKIKDIDFDSYMITITKSKNRKGYLIPLSSTLANVLKEYLQYRGGCTEDYVFCDAYGGKGDRRTYQEHIREYNHMRGVSKTSAHLFRHTFAKNWILNDGDIFRLQKILGHATLDIVKEYVNLYGVDLQNNFDRYNPLDHLIAGEQKKKIQIKRRG